jgi:hypothetical protein
MSSFDICYSSESAQGLVVLLRGSRLLEVLFLPWGIENSLYGLAFVQTSDGCGQIRVHVGVRQYNS